MNNDYDGKRIPYDENFIYKPVIIGKNVWIGMNVCITSGEITNDGAIVGMGTLVSGEVPSFAIRGSEKWRFLGHRDVDHYIKSERARLFGGINGVQYIRKLDDDSKD